MRLPNVNKLSDSQLWQLCLMPIEDRMPARLKEYLKEAEKEFRSRKVKLYPIMK